MLRAKVKSTPNSKTNDRKTNLIEPVRTHLQDNLDTGLKNTYGQKYSNNKGIENETSDVFFFFT